MLVQGFKFFFWGKGEGSYRLVHTVEPVGQPPISSHSVANPGPAALWIAPHIPPPAQRLEFAAFTMASILKLDMYMYMFDEKKDRERYDDHQRRNLKKRKR